VSSSGDAHRGYARQGFRGDGWLWVAGPALLIDVIPQLSRTASSSQPSLLPASCCGCAGRAVRARPRLIQRSGARQRRNVERLKLMLQGGRYACPRYAESHPCRSSSGERAPVSTARANFFCSRITASTYNRSITRLWARGQERLRNSLPTPFHTDGGHASIWSMLWRQSARATGLATRRKHSVSKPQPPVRAAPLVFDPATDPRCSWRAVLKERNMFGLTALETGRGSNSDSPYPPTIIFPAITIGLGELSRGAGRPVACGRRTPTYRDLYHFWSHIFAVNFAMGVVFRHRHGLPVRPPTGAIILPSQEALTGPLPQL